VVAGLAAAKRRGRRGGRLLTLDAEQITPALNRGTTKASVCRTFKVLRSTLLGTLKRIG
jgi:hypothetical protein